MDPLEKDRFLCILDKFEAGSSTTGEAAFLNAYYNAFGLKDGFIKTLTDMEREKLKNELLNKVKMHLASRQIQA